MDNEKNLFGLKRNVFWLGLVSLVNDLSSEMIYSVMPAFLTVVMGAPPVFVGFIEGFADALASILKVYFGWFSDKIGKRKILAVIGYTLSTSTRWFLAFVGNFWQVFILRAIDRIGKGLRDSPRDALISESVEARELGKSFGYHRAMDAVGTTIGPLVAILILQLTMNDYKMLFKIAFGIGILSILTFFFVKDKKKETRAPYLPAGGSVRSIAGELDSASHTPFTFSLKSYSREFREYILAVFIFGLGFMPLALILLKANEIGISNFSIPLMYFIYNFAFVSFAIPAGKLSDKIGEKKVLTFGFLAAIIAYLILALFSNTTAVILGFVILGLYSATTDGIGRALAAKLVPVDKLATGQGFLNSAIGISSLIAGLSGGIIWTKFGSSPALIYGAVMMTAGLLALLHLNRRHKTA